MKKSQYLCQPLSRSGLLKTISMLGVVAGTFGLLSHSDDVLAQAPTANGDVFINSIGMELVAIPAGDFMMGAPHLTVIVTRAASSSHSTR